MRGKWGVMKMPLSQTCHEDHVSGSTECVWDSAGPQAFFYQDIQDKWDSQFKHNPVGIHSSEYGDNLSITPPSRNISTSVNSGLGTQLKSSQS